jgi:two-component system chemotaxis response regulator CheB
MTMTGRLVPLRVLVVDDSAFNRRSIGDMLSHSAEVEVVGKAADGEEALRLAALLKPDAITLDLEMPRMDGFTLLRILMSKMPTPVIVVSSYAQKENVFKALELGAIDFVAKPDRFDDAELRSIREELLQKILMVRNLRASAIAPRPRFETRAEAHPVIAKAAPPRYIVAIGSSTGGPTALMDIFGRLPRRTHLGYLIAQHMPDKFTRTFAERLDRRGPVRITEAQDNDMLTERVGFVCPGRRSMQLMNGSEGDLRLRILAPHPEDRYVPSVDRLFSSVARAAAERAVGVILTGMGDDGVKGAREILDRGGQVIAESERTAVVYGMPGAAVRAGVTTRVLGLPDIAQFLSTLG